MDINKNSIGQIKMFKEVGQEAVEIILKVRLENGVTLYVTDNGYAEGSDGNRYYCIAEDNLEEDTLTILGWSSDIRGELVF